MLGDDAYWASSLAKTLAPYAAAQASGIASTLASLQRFYAGDDYLRAARAAAGFDAPSWSKLADAAAAAAGVHAVLRDNPAFRGAAGIDTILKGVVEANVPAARAFEIAAGFESASWLRLSERVASAAASALMSYPSPTALAAGMSLDLAASGLDGWRKSMLAARSATALAAATPALSGLATQQLRADLASSSSVTARLASAAASTVRLFPQPASAWLGQRPAARLGEYLVDLHPHSPERDLRVGLSAEHGVSALLTWDVLQHEQDEEAREEAADLFEQEVKPSWVAGPARGRSDLLAALGRLDKDLPDLLMGAWEDIERPGAAANVKISTCAVEALERTLRALAPEAEVLSWHREGRRPPEELSNGRPTHSCRVRFILRSPELKKLRPLVVAQTESIVIQVNSLRTILQSGKHASSGDLRQLENALMSVETVLHQLTVALD